MMRPILAGLEGLAAHAAIDAETLADALQSILDGEVEPALIRELLLHLNEREPEPRMLATLASVLRQNSRPVPCAVRPLVDTCGTGGDCAGTFNISTAAAFVVAAAGGAVAKHGNRSVSSQTGSADVLEALGVPLDLTPSECGRMIETSGLAFLYAPAFQPGMRHVQPVRRALGVPTLFNLVGPLTNPACAEYQVVGVSAPSYTEPMALALQALGSRGAVVVHCAGVDEFALHAPTIGHRLRDRHVEPFQLDPRDHGIARAPISALAGGDAQHNAELMRALLAGAPGPLAEAVALNAGVACFVAGLADSVDEGLDRARTLLRNGLAERVLERTLESARRMRGETVV